MTQNVDPYNKAGFYAFVGCMVASFLFFIWISFLHPGVDLKEVASGEARAKAMAKAPSDDASSTNANFDINSVEKPWAENSDVVAYGKSVYAINCTACHGAEGDGKGPAGASLKPAPRDFIEGKWTVGGSSISLFKTITDGISGTSMSTFAHLPVKDRWAIVQFIRSITKNKVKDDMAKLDEFAQSAK